MKINVLGTEYKVIFQSKKENEKLSKVDGYCDFYVKKIYVSIFEKDFWSVEDLERYKNKVVRHEILHAFMYESGLDVESNFARDEVLIDWLAIQIPKITKLFEKKGVM